MESTQSADGLKAVVALFQSPVRLAKAVQEIQRLSLAVQRSEIPDPETPDRIIWIHDLVQFLVRSKLMVSVERMQWLEITIYIICKRFEEIDNYESPANWSQCRKFITHIQAMGRFAEQYKLRYIELLDASTMAGNYLNACGLYNEAVSMIRQTWHKKMDLLGAEHPNTLTSMNNLAVIFRNQGQWKEAEVLGWQVMEMRIRVLEGSIQTHCLAWRTWHQQFGIKDDGKKLRSWMCE